MYDYVMILTSVKQKMRNEKGTGTFVERLQAALAFCATEHGRNLADLKVSFMVFQHVGHRFEAWNSWERCAVSSSRFASISITWGVKVCTGGTVQSIWKMLGEDFNLQ